MIRFGLVLLGVYVAVVGAVVHRHTVEVGDVQWPWGLVLALAATIAVGLAAGKVGRVGDAWFALGWTLVLTVQSFAPGGSYLVANDWLGWAYAVLGMGSLGVVVVRNSRRHATRLEQ